MSTSSPTSASVSPPAHIARPDKTNKPSRTVVLKISPAKLSQFLPKPTTKKNSKTKSTPSSLSTPISASATAPLITSSPNGDASESNATPAPSTTDVPKKKATAAKAGTKRALGSLDGGSKARRSAPKKQKVDDGTADHNGKPNGGGVTTGSHKLGPKANQGAINARLRALDRTKHPCRKWERKPIQLKSFTGVVWELPSWRAPKSRLPNEEDRHNKDVSQLSESKAHDSSTAMESEKSNAGENGAVPLKDSTPTASSPVPAPLLPAVVAAG